MTDLEADIERLNELCGMDKEECLDYIRVLGWNSFILKVNIWYITKQHHKASQVKWYRKIWRAMTRKTTHISYNVPASYLVEITTLLREDELHD